ncbi:putative Ig domain-containing protein, partial [Arthrobacter alkaliphilus]
SYGFAAAYASGTNRPNSSNLNFTTGQTVPNAVTVPVGTDGKVTLYNRSNGTTHFIADVSGYYLTGTPTAPLVISDGVLHDGVAGARYLEQVTATGGTQPVTWTATGLPSGLTLTPDGALAGIPANTGTTTVTLTATDAAGTQATATRILNVPTTMPAGCAGTACAVLTASTRTVQVPAAAIKSLTRDSTTQKVATVTLTGPAVNGTTITAGQVLVLAPTPDIESGAIVYINTLTSNPDGTTTASVTPTTPADAYTEGTVNSIDPTLTSGSPATVAQSFGTTPAPSVTTQATSASALQCDAGVTAVPAGLSTTTNMTPSLAAIWKHPIFGFGGVYVGTGGLDLFQFDLDGTITVNLGASISGQGQCILTLPEAKTRVPAGELGFVALSARPTLTLEVTGTVAMNTSITLKCGAEYRWSAGAESRTKFCSTTSLPLALTSTTGVEAKATAAINLGVALDDMVGITGQLNAAIDTNYTPTTHPIATIDATAGYELGACLACFWSGSPAHVTMLTGTFFTKRIATYDTPPPPPPASTGPLTITTTSLPAATAGTAYRATLSDAGGTGPYTWTITTGTLPPGLTLEPTNGTITGIPTQAGTSNLTITVTDNHNSTTALTTTLTTQPAAPPSLSGVKTIVSSGNAAYALKNDGTVWAWGQNTYGQLGNGTTTNSSTAVQVASLTGVTAITATVYNAYALLQDGTVRAWGFNSYGQLGNGTTIDSSTPVQVAGITGATAITAHSFTAYALLQDGTVRAWGDNSYGELGNGTTTNSSTPVQVTGITGATAITAYEYKAYAVLQDGTVRAWGDNSYGELGNGTTTNSSTPVQVTGLTGATAVTASYFNAYAVLQDGTVRAWGQNTSGQLGNGTTTNSNTPVQVTGITGATAITARGSTAYALLRDGTVRAWGDNGYGQFGNGTSANTSLSPVQVTGLTGATAITANNFNAYAVLQDGSVWAWGDNSYGELGNGTTTNSSTPIQVSGLTAAALVPLAEYGNGTVYALLTDGTVRAWGDNYYGQLGNGTTTPSSTPVQVRVTSGP